MTADSSRRTFTVEAEAARLDQFLARQLSELSRTQLKKLIQQGEVRVGDQTGQPSQSLLPGEVVTVTLPPQKATTPQAEAITLPIIYEDEALVVVNKPAGMVVHPGHGHEGGTLVNALLARYPDLAALSDHDARLSDRPGIVHRLDQDTSGVMVVARTPTALTHLQRQFKGRAVQKRYWALVHGEPPAPEGIIDIPLGRHTTHRQRIAPRADGKPARTLYQVQQTFTGYSLLDIDLETGRTHQIRVHLAWLKCPVVGDTVYGRRKNNLDLGRQFLHARQLQVEHPQTEQPMTFEAPLDPSLQAVLDRLRGEVDDGDSI